MERDSTCRFPPYMTTVARPGVSHVCCCPRTMSRGQARSEAAKAQAGTAPWNPDIVPGLLDLLFEGCQLRISVRVFKNVFKQKQGKNGETPLASPLVASCHMPAAAGTRPGQSRVRGLHLDLPHAWQGTKDSSHHLLPRAFCVNRKLESGRELAVQNGPQASQSLSYTLSSLLSVGVPPSSRGDLTWPRPQAWPWGSRLSAPHTQGSGCAGHVQQRGERWAGSHQHRLARNRVASFRRVPGECVRRLFITL